MPDTPHRCWSDAADYRYLEGVSRYQFAWEWLRRDPDYRQLAPSIRQQTSWGLTIVEPASPACRERWGCLWIEDARLPSPETPMLWHPDLDASLLRVEARRARSDGSPLFDARQWGDCAVMVAGGEGDEHLLLHKGGQRVGLHVVAGSLLDGPVELLFDFGRLDRFEPHLTALKRLLHLWRQGEWPPEAMRGDRHLHRAITALRVHDALVEGASIRDIGILLFGEERIAAQWRDPGESLKSQCRRLITSARAMADGGYKNLLRKL